MGMYTCRTEVIEGEVPANLADIVSKRRKELIGRHVYIWSIQFSYT